MNNRSHHRVRNGLLILGAAALFIVGVAWWGLAQSNNPSYQARITMPSMAGTQEYFINMWVEPTPLRVGDATLTGQVTSTIGSATHVDELTFLLSPPNGADTLEVPATKAGGDAPAESFRASATFDAPGRWQVTVQIRNGDLTRAATYDVDVSS